MSPFPLLSVEPVEFGCAVLYGSPKDDTDQLRICENNPALGEWIEQIAQAIQALPIVTGKET
jgi:hypothetical protein